MRSLRHTLCTHVRMRFDYPHVRHDQGRVGVGFFSLSYFKHHGNPRI